MRLGGLTLRDCFSVFSKFIFWKPRNGLFQNLPFSWANRQITSKKLRHSSDQAQRRDLERWMLEHEGPAGWSPMADISRWQLFVGKKRKR
jgi:hypothetical protein